MEIVLECTHCEDVQPVRTFADGRAFLRAHRACGETYLREDLATDGGISREEEDRLALRAVVALESIAAAAEALNIRQARREALDGGPR